MLRVVLILAFIVSFSFFGGVHLIRPVPKGESFYVESSFNKNKLIEEIINLNINKIFFNKETYIPNIVVSSNNKYLASNFGTKIIKIWNIQQKKEVYVLKGHNASIRFLEFSPNGKYLASASDDTTIKLWNIEKQKEEFTLNGHSSGVRSLAFSSDGKYLASSSFDKTIKLWDFKTKRELSTFKGHNNSISSVAFNPNGKYLASSSYDTMIKLWDIETKKELFTFKGDGSIITPVVFSPNGKYLASSLNYTIIKIWDIETKKELFTLKGHSSNVRSLVFSSNGKYLASASDDATIKLWDIEKQKEIFTFKGHHSGISSLVFSSNGKYLISGSNDKTIKLWDIETKKELFTFKGKNKSINSISFNKDGKYLASGSNDKTIELWDIEKQKEIFTFKGHENIINSVVFSPNGKYLASGSNDKTIKLWDIEEQKEIFTLRGHKNLITSVKFSPDGKYLASSSFDNTIKLWDIEKQKEFFTAKGYRFEVDSISFNPNGKYLAYSSNGIIEILDIEKKRKIYRSNRQAIIVYSIAFNSSGKYLAYTSDDYKIKLWDIEKQKEIMNLEGIENTVYSIDFSSNNKYLVIGSSTGKIKLWDIEKQKEINTFYNFDGSILSVKFSPDNKYLASGSYYGKIKIFDIETKKEIATLISRDDKWAWITDKYIKRKDDGKLVQKIKSQNGNFIELEPIYPNQPHDGNLTILKYPEKVTIYEGQTGKGEITIKNDSLGRLWWIDLLEENTTNCNLFAPERIQLLEANETKTLKFELSAIRDYEFPKEEEKNITLRLEAVKTKPIIIKVPIEIKSPMMKLTKVYLTDEKKGKILNVELQNIGGQDLNSSEIVTTLITKDTNISLDKIEKSLIKAGEITKVTYPIDENLSLKDSKVKVFVRKNIYPIHTWEFESEIKVISSYFYHYIALAILVLIILYYIRALTHPLTKKLSLNPKELNNLDFKEIIQAKKLLSRLYRLNTILSENEIDREVLDKTIEFYKTKDKAKKVKILSERVFSDSQKIKENLFRINLTKEFILNINSIDIIFIDKLNDETQKELNKIKTFTIVVTNNTIREKLKAKNYLLIIPTSNEIARILISNNSLLALSHLLSNYIKLSQISPYQISQGVRNSLMFFGREKSLSHILSRELTNYFLIGARQIGKSSFLKEIERNYKDISGIDCYYYTLNDDNLLELLGINLWAKNDLKLEEFIQKMRIYGKPILFLLDEVDKFIVSETKSDFKILNAFRALSEEGKCFFVMAGYWELYKSIYLNYFSPIKNFGEVLHIEELEYEACIDLATKPMSALNLSYENESIVKEMVKNCGQRANLIAINCNLMIQKLNLKDKIITKEMIESTQKSQDFVSHLKFSESDRLTQMILYFTIELNSFNLSELVEILENENIKFEIELLKEALNKMEIAFYIKKIENRYYYRVPLFVEYIRGDDLEILKREIKK